VVAKELLLKRTSGSRNDFESSAQNHAPKKKPHAPLRLRRMLVNKQTATTSAAHIMKPIIFALRSGFHSAPASPILRHAHAGAALKPMARSLAVLPRAREALRCYSPTPEPSAMPPVTIGAPLWGRLVGRFGQVLGFVVPRQTFVRGSQVGGGGRGRKIGDDEIPTAAAASVLRNQSAIGSRSYWA
jgi:hypothetical protein